MISGTPIVEITIIHSEPIITGLNGHFNFRYLDQLEKDLTEDPPVKIEKLLEEVGEDSIIKAVLHLQEIDPEKQYGTGYGDILVLPGYYDITKIEIMACQSKEAEHGTD